MLLWMHIKFVFKIIFFLNFIYYIAVIAWESANLYLGRHYWSNLLNLQNPFNI